MNTIATNTIAPVDFTEFETYLLDGTVVEVLRSGKQTNGAFTMLRCTMPPSTLTVARYDLHQDETLYVLEGVLQVETQGRTIALPASETITLPRNVPHRLGNATSSVTRILMFTTPDGFGDFVKEVGERVYSPETRPAAMTDARIAHLQDAALRYGIVRVTETTLRAGSLAQPL